ncbi:MAG: hypothetical protein AVO34_14015 [Firmicutes bacterium ML8_F2]|jgi:multicomponent Na+:H+ antiporter subunit B|nr:MAG: hypothetical protein AVO34_14015 [Firmicutes bacterium ML8_F2]
MRKTFRVITFAISLFLVTLITLMLMLAVTEMPPYGHIDNPTNNEIWVRYVTKSAEESGGLNVVANVLLDYRGYDTLLESTVLFVTVVSIMLVWVTGTGKKEIAQEEAEEMEDYYM